MEQGKLRLKLGKRISEIRNNKKITLEKLAYENDIPKSTLSRIERGLVDARVSNIGKIAEGLDISIKDLFNF